MLAEQRYAFVQLNFLLKSTVMALRAFNSSEGIAAVVCSVSELFQCA